MNGRDIVVIGCSAGGLQVLCTLVRGLPADLPAAVFLVIHTGVNNGGMLPRILSNAGPLPAAHAEQGQTIRHGHIYVAPSDRHLILDPGRVRLTRGPKENLFRPAVDPLFRSAAASYGERVIGVVLSGGMDDGTEGLMVIKRRGGIAIAQDPDDALVPSMPSSAIRHVGVDHVLPAIEIGPVLDRLSRAPLIHEVRGSATGNPGKGAQMKEKGNELGLDIETMEAVNGAPSGFTCPECGGALWERKRGDVLRFRCHVGHGFTGDSLASEQANRLEAALWTAVRSLKERVVLQRQMASRALAAQMDEVAQAYEEQALDAERDAMVIREMLIGQASSALDPPPQPSHKAAAAPPRRITRVAATGGSSQGNGPTKKARRL